MCVCVGVCVCVCVRERERERERGWDGILHPVIQGCRVVHYNIKSLMPKTRELEGEIASDNSLLLSILYLFTGCFLLNRRVSTVRCNSRCNTRDIKT